MTKFQLRIPQTETAYNTFVYVCSLDKTLPEIEDLYKKDPSAFLGMCEAQDEFPDILTWHTETLEFDFSKAEIRPITS